MPSEAINLRRIKELSDYDESLLKQNGTIIKVISRLGVGRSSPSTRPTNMSGGGGGGGDTCALKAPRGDEPTVERRARSTRLNMRDVHVHGAAALKWSAL